MKLHSIRSLILTALLALTTLAASPAGAQEASPAASAPEASPLACPPLSPEAVRARAQEFIDAIDAEDLDRLGGLISDHHRHHWSIGSDAHDRDGYLATMGNLFDAFDDFSLTVDDVIQADGAAVLRVTASGTQVRPFGGFPASDQPATWTGILILQFDDCGRVVEAWGEFDHLGRLLQQGSIVAPEATPAA